jgi:carbamoyl-phosphate synthase large subunit
VLRRNGVRATIVRKHSEGVGPDGEPDIVARILDGQVDLIVNTPFGSPGQSGPRLDGYEIRTAAVRRQIPCVTTIQGLAAAVQGIEAITRGEVGVRSLQEYVAALRGGERRPRTGGAMTADTMTADTITGDTMAGDTAAADTAAGRPARPAAGGEP